jgi:hypothetical protein
MDYLANGLIILVLFTVVFGPIAIINAVRTREPPTKYSAEIEAEQIILAAFEKQPEEREEA